MSSRRGDRFKRPFDLVVGSALLVVSLPVQAGVAIAIKHRLASDMA